MPESDKRAQSDAGRRLEGRVAIITGGAGGIGSATAALFCAERAKVLITDTNAAALAETATAVRAQFPNAQIETFKADVSSAEDAQAAVAKATKAFGGLDVLVNNAAVRNLANVGDSDPAEWDRLISINLRGAVNFSKAALPALRQSKHASIVIVSSVYGVVGRAGWPIYDATKAALLALTRSLAHEEAKHGIRANAVCPGATLTPYTLQRNMALGKSEDEVRNEKRADSLLGRWARPEEIAYPILWLASAESSFMTGATIMVDGGLSAM